MGFTVYTPSTINTSLKFKHDKNLSKLVGYVNSNFGGDLDKYCSTIEYLLLLIKF